ncbi:unnamed protein product, partial [Brenthis ino]
MPYLNSQVPYFLEWFMAVFALRRTDFQSATVKDECFTNFKDKATQVCSEATNKLVQVCLKATIRSKAIQTTSQIKYKNTSPLKTNTTSIATSPFKVTMSGVPSARFMNTKIKRKLLFTSEKLEMSSSNSSTPVKHSLSKTETSPSVQSLVIMTSSSSDQETQSELAQIKKKIEAENLCKISIENTVRLIKNNPRYYIGTSNRNPCAKQSC